MKQSGSNPWKLGLFVVLGLGSCAGGLWWLGLQRFNRETYETVTYFDESVNGLDTGAPVKMRGVRIGTVSEITFAADQRRVEVHSLLYRDVLKSLGLDFGQNQIEGTRPELQRGMRVQLAVTGLTGIRFLLVDFLDPKRYPEPELPFEPPTNYLPAAPSTLKSLETGLVELLDELPPIVKQVDDLLALLTQKLDEIDARGLSEKIVGVLDELERKLGEIEPTALVEDARGAVADLRALLARLGSEEGPLEGPARRWESLAQRLEGAVDEAQLGQTASTLRDTAQSFRSFAREAGALTGDVQASLLAFRETLRALRALAEYLERDPAALLRGRTAE